MRFTQQRPASCSKNLFQPVKHLNTAVKEGEMSTAQGASAACVPFREVLPYIKVPKDLCSAIQLCKDWSELADNEAVWRALATQRYPAAEQDISSYRNWKAMVFDENREHVAHAVRLSPQDTLKCGGPRTTERFYMCLLPAWDTLFSAKRNFFRLEYDARGEADCLRPDNSALMISIDIRPTTEVMSANAFRDMIDSHVLSLFKHTSECRDEPQPPKCQYFINGKQLGNDKRVWGRSGHMAAKLTLYCSGPTREWVVDAQQGHFKGILQWSDTEFAQLPNMMQAVQSSLSGILDGTLCPKWAKLGAKMSKLFGGKRDVTCTASLVVDFANYVPRQDTNVIPEYLKPVRLMSCKLDNSNLNSKNLLLQCMKQASCMKSTHGLFARRDALEQQLLAESPADELALWTACLPDGFLDDRPDWYKESKPVTAPPRWKQVWLKPETLRAMTAGQMPPDVADAMAEDMANGAGWMGYIASGDRQHEQDRSFQPLDPEVGFDQYIGLSPTRRGLCRPVA